MARTVETPQGSYEQFLNELSRYLGRRATVTTAAGTHLTFLNSKGPRRAFSRCRYTAKDVGNFSGDMQSFLSTEGYGFRMAAQVSQDEPLVLKGRNRRKIALNIIPDSELIAQRMGIEDFLRDRFGNVPVLEEFRSHITVGEVDIHSADRKSRADFISRLGKTHEYIAVPPKIALNGLEVYLDEIRD